MNEEKKKSYCFLLLFSGLFFLKSLQTLFPSNCLEVVNSYVLQLFPLCIQQITHSPCYFNLFGSKVLTAEDNRIIPTYLVSKLGWLVVCAYILVPDFAVSQDSKGYPYLKLLFDQCREYL